jgi:hypothetical protein
MFCNFTWYLEKELALGLNRHIVKSLERIEEIIWIQVVLVKILINLIA